MFFRENEQMNKRVVITEQESDCIAQVMSTALFGAHRKMCKPGLDDAGRRVWAFQVIHINNIVVKAGALEYATRLTVDQFGDIVQSAVDELARQNWTQYAPGVLK
jgi:hypothetical protein